MRYAIDDASHLEMAMNVHDSEREARLRELAAKLLFTLDQHGGRFTLRRDADVSTPVRHDDLTLDEAEEILNAWKLRGFHGG
jgi:hypothetical protein